MATQSDFARKAEEIISHVNMSGAAGGEPAYPGDILSVIHNLHQLFPQWVVMVCPRQHPELFYVSENCEGLFGETCGHMMSHPEEYFRRLYEDDVEDLYKCFGFAQEYVEAESPEERHKIRLVYQYRYRHRDGNYVLLHDEKAVFRTGDDRYLFYSLFRDVTAEEVFGGVKVEVYKQGTALKKITEYKPSATLPLSKREAEVFVLIKKGLTTKEIAAQLGISHHTVRNFRSKLFEKYRVSNTVELINAVG